MKPTYRFLGGLAWLYITVLFLATSLVTIDDWVRASLQIGHGMSRIPIGICVVATLSLVGLTSMFVGGIYVAKAACREMSPRGTTRPVPTKLDA
jgi:hypothetical protein